MFRLVFTVCIHMLGYSILSYILLGHLLVSGFFSLSGYLSRCLVTNQPSPFGCGQSFQFSQCLQQQSQMFFVKTFFKVLLLAQLFNSSATVIHNCFTLRIAKDFLILAFRCVSTREHTGEKFEEKNLQPIICYECSCVNRVTCCQSPYQSATCFSCVAWPDKPRQLVLHVMSIANAFSFAHI